MQLVLCGGESSEDNEFGDFVPDTLCSIPPGIEWNNKFSDWGLRKVEEIKEYVGISCDGYEEKFRALLIAIEARQPSLAKSASK